MTVVLEGKCPGCGWWVRLESGEHHEHMETTGEHISWYGWSSVTGFYSQRGCPWAGRQPPETRPEQLELEEARA